MNIRDAEPADVDSLAAIERSSFADPWSREAFAELMSAAHGRTMVATDGEGLVLGYCVLLVASDEAEIANLAVATVARGAGVGGALLDAALAKAEHERVRVVYLEVRVSNVAARALYGSRHFIAVGRRTNYYQHPPEDALVLRRVQLAAGTN